MCEGGLGGEFKRTVLTPWKGEASLSNQLYRKPRKAGEKAAKDAAAAEAQRQARISENVGNVNAAFGGRDAQYADFGNALREALNTQLAQQRADATRETKFSLARAGQTGGSAAIDAGKRLARENQEGALAVERQARGGVAQLQAQDEDTRTRLIGLAQSGNDIGNATAQTAAALRANLGASQNAANVNSLTGIFANTAAANKLASDAAARRRGLKEAETYAAPFTR